MSNNIKNNQTPNLLLSQRFLPEIGGSITWMSEVYKRWPESVDLFTHDYSEYTKSSIEEIDSSLIRETSFNNIYRDNILMSSWGIDNLDSLKKYSKMRNHFKKYLKAKKTPVIHTTHAVPEVSSLHFLPKPLLEKAKIITYAHGEEILACSSSAQLNFLQKRSYNLTDLIIANSENTKKILEKITDKRIEVIHPGINFKEFSAAEELGSTWRDKNNFKQDDFLLLTLARLCSRKNQIAVIGAMGILKNEFPNLHYIVAGDGDIKEVLVKHANQLEISERVHFVGSVSEREKIELYGASNLFIMPSKQIGPDIEGFGISYIEAAAAGKTSIAGNSGGEKESVIDANTGLVVKLNTPDEIAYMIRQLYENKELREALENNAKKRAKELDWANVVNRTYNLIEEV